MFADDKFHKNARKQVEVDYLQSMNLAQPSEWTKEETRIRLTLRYYGEEETYTYFHINMSRAEAKKIGETLVRYGNTKIVGEEGCNER